MPGLTVIFISWSKYFITAFSCLCGSYECLSKCPERWDGKRSVGMGLFCNWDMAKYILPSLGLILLAELVMCIGSEMRSALFLLIAQGSEWPEGLMSVDMQSISLDIVIYNDTAGQCIFSDNMKQWHSVQNAEYRRRCHRQTLGMDLQKLRWKAFSFLFFSFCFCHVLCSSLILTIREGCR